MIKHRTRHYFVQIDTGGFPEIVFHTHNEETDEYYHKFFSRQKANDLIKAEKKITPDARFRVVKCTETYEASPWQ